MHRDQRGFTLIEVIIAVAITGIIIGGIAMSITQMFVLNARTTSRMLVVHQVQHAGSWIIRDAQNADTVTVEVYPTLMRLERTDRQHRRHAVTYTIENGELRRRHYQNGVRQAESLVAQFIDPARTSASFDEISGVLTFTVTATVGEHSETGVHKIVPRPGR